MDPYEINALAKRANREDINSTQESAAVSLRKMFDEISSSESDIYRALYAYGQNPDPIARAKGLHIYQEMMEDDQVKACIELRLEARLSTQWMIHSAEEGNAQADEYAEFINYVLNSMQGTFADNLYNIYSATWFGFSLTEKVLKYYEDGPWAGKIGLAALKTREPYNYDFKTDMHGNLLGIVYTGAGNILVEQMRQRQSNANTGQQVTVDENKVTLVAPNTPTFQGALGSNANPYPIEKFVIYSFKKLFSNWYGRSDLLAAYRSWQTKKHVMKFWNIWLERYASPFLWAQYKRDVGINPKSLQEIDGFMKNLSAKNSLRTSDAITIKAIESSGTAADAYEKAIEAHNRYISHALLFPNLMGFTGDQGSGGAGGSYGLGKKQFDAFVWTLEKLGRDTSETIVGEQIIKPLIKLNFPNVDEDLIPTFTFESVQESTIQARADILAKLAQYGFVNPDEAWVREFLSLPKVEKGIVLEKPELDPFGNPIKKQNPDEDPEDQEGDEAAEPADEKEEPDEPEEKADSQKKEMAIKKEAVIRKKYEERTITIFEKKVRVREFGSQSEAVSRRMMDDLTPLIVEIRDQLIRTIQKKKFIPDSDMGAVNKLTLNIGEFKKTVRAWLVKIHLDSKLRAMEELARGGVKAEIVTKFAEAPFYEWEPVPPSEAVDFFNRKVSVKVAAKDGKMIAIDLATGKELPLYDQRSFTISGIVKEDILNGAKNIILNGIKRQDEPGTITDIKDMFNKYIQQGVMEGDELLSPHRLETIVRTNMNEAINEGRRSMYEDPDVEGFVPFFQYSAILDDRTTDYCECMDERIFRIEDLAEINPPAHFNCRSFTVPITQAEVDDMREAGEGVEISDVCPDRASGFSDLKRDPIYVPKGVENLKTMPKTEPAKEELPAPRRTVDVALDNELKEILSQIIVRCPYAACGHSAITMRSQKLNVGEFDCDKCGMPFRVSNKGDIYLYDAGLDKWERASVGLFPSHFQKKG